MLFIWHIICYIIYAYGFRSFTVKRFQNFQDEIVHVMTVIVNNIGGEDIVVIGCPDI